MSKYFAQSASQRCSLVLLRCTRKIWTRKIKCNFIFANKPQILFPHLFFGISQQLSSSSSSSTWAGERSETVWIIKIFQLEYFLLATSNFKWNKRCMEFPAVPKSLFPSFALFLYRSTDILISLKSWLAGWHQKWMCIMPYYTHCTHTEISKYKFRKLFRLFVCVSHTSGSSCVRVRCVYIKLCVSCLLFMKPPQTGFMTRFVNQVFVLHLVPRCYFFVLLLLLLLFYSFLIDDWKRTSNVSMCTFLFFRLF